MTQTPHTPNAVVHLGDCLEVLRTLPDASTDALVTDPPAGIGFMGRAWDGAKGGREKWISWLADIMREAMRALKPGAHGFVWALPRTSHWTGTALEEAGFEVRDVVTHLFGTGFPKSHNVSKAIDKTLGKERPVVGPVSNPARNRDGTDALGGGWQSAPQVTAPASDLAAQWDGWGTALKPACEFWFLVRRPFKGIVARNVMEHGTGGLNIDGCRVATDEQRTAVYSGAKGTKQAEYGAGAVDGSSDKYLYTPSNEGRWPAHLVLDEEAGRMLDAQSGVRAAGVRKGLGYHGIEQGDGGPEVKSSAGGASRFFYCAKASRSEREAGLERMEKRTLCQNIPDRESSPEHTHRNGLNRQKQRANRHPTVKPLALMAWLLRLITPPGGTVLDPFAGSGSTGVACMREGFSFIGIEQSEEYVEVARRRIAHAAGEAIP